MNIASLLAESAHTFPDRPALSVGPRTRFNYNELQRRCSALATWLRDESKGTPVAVTCPNCPEYLELLFSPWWAGLAVAPMNARLSADELAYMIEDCGAAVAFAGIGQAEELRTRLPWVQILVPGEAQYEEALSAGSEPCASCDTDDTAWIFYTSGTTGKPKGAMLTHGNLGAMNEAYLADVDSLGNDDALLHLAPTSHASGLFALSFIAVGGNNVLPESDRFDADELCALAEHYSSLSFFLPPPILKGILGYGLEGRIRTEHLKTVLLGAAPISVVDLRNATRVFGPRLWNGYGQGETPCTITAMSKSMLAQELEAANEDRLQSVGTARHGIELRIVSESGVDVEPGEPGEILVRGPTVMKGYLHRHEATQETLRNGWLHTGDIGSLDRDGYLTLIDRKKDVIISGGINIYAREIEDVLAESDLVKDVAVIGVPDEKWGEAVMAVVESAGDTPPAAETLESLCLEKLARFKRPKHYRFVEQLPRNSTGKVLKRELRRQYESGIPE